MDEKKRSRKKQLYHDILKQVEFYFSPANLAKDRFMTHALAENGNGIEINVLMTFNKLKTLTADVNILVKALRLSEILELTENETRVKSKVVFKKKENEDDCTIYVERLPLDANVDFMRQVFSPYGEIDYVSLPKFHNGKIKGFGFVEFAEPSSALKAIEEFKRTGGYLPIDMAPGNLRSICTFDKKMKERLLSSRNRQFDYDECISSRDEMHDDMNIMAEEIENVEINFETAKPPSDSSFDCDDNEKKRKHKTSPSTLERKKKKPKSDDKEGSETDQNLAELSVDSNKDISTESINDKTNENLTDKSSENVTEQDSKKYEQTGEDTEMSDQDQQDDENSHLKVKKKRRQKKKSKRDRPSTNCGLLILSKSDWKKLRNKYLNVQWMKMRSLKKHLYKCKQHFQPGSSEGDQFNMQESFVEVPNSVIKIQTEQPVVDIKAFKAEVKSKSNDIIHIDVKEGVSEVHIRFSTTEAACEFSKSVKTWKNHIISGVEEQEYWMKIHYERENKWEKQNKKASAMEEKHGENGSDITEKKPTGKGGLQEKPTLTFKPGTVVRLLISDPIINVKEFKNDLKMSCKDVLYVDVKEGSCEAYIRLDTPENAKKFSSDITHGKVIILSGEEEKQYWDKINEDRVNKFNKTVKVNKRGKQKLIKKAEKIMGKHILFDDSDDMIISHHD